MATDELAGQPPGATIRIVTLPNQFHGKGTSSPCTQRAHTCVTCAHGVSEASHKSCRASPGAAGTWVPLKKIFPQSIGCEETRGGFANSPATLADSRLGKHRAVFCRDKHGLHLDLGGKPARLQSKALAEFTASQRPSAAEASPAPGKVTCGPSSFRHVTRPRLSPGHKQQCQHSKGRAAPKQHTWDHKYQLIYIILQLKGTKRLIAFQLGLGLHQRPQELIPSAAESRARCESSSSSSQRRNPPLEPGNSE